MANAVKAKNGRRVCTICGVEKEESFFALRSDDKRYRLSRCRGCENDRGHQKQKLRVDIMNAYKTQEGCVDCGYTSFGPALDFDHLPGTEKSFNIGQGMRHMKWDAIIEEMLKCEIVCANCHRVRTWKRANGIDLWLRTWEATGT